MFEIRLRVYATLAITASIAWTVVLEPVQAQQDPPASQIENPASLANLLDEYDALEAEIQEAKRKRQSDRLRTLQARRETLLNQIEQLVGGPAPTLSPQAPVPLEQSLKQREHHQDAILENNAQRRLPSK